MKKHHPLHLLVPGFIFLTTLFLFAPNLTAQRISVGVITGVGITSTYGSASAPVNIWDPVQETPTPGRIHYDGGSRGWIVGPMLELHLAKGFSVEANALRRPVELTQSIRYPDGSLFTGGDTFHNTTWQFPILAKYRFSTGNVRPFITAGPSIRRGGHAPGMSKLGITLGVGVETQVRRLKIAPTVRYTRWREGDFAALVKENQVEFLVGFSF
jgi:opacity protein-like surface antigen